LVTRELALAAFPVPSCHPKTYLVLKRVRNYVRDNHLVNEGGDGRWKKMSGSWRHKWQRIGSKFATCTEECVTAYRTDEKCRDSIEAVVADIWNLKDWLASDPEAGVSIDDIHAFLGIPESHNIRACGDLETHAKHLNVDDLKREHTRLEWNGIHDHPSGFPVIFAVRRIYRANPADHDEWEDAFELARRAIEEWRAFLRVKRLL
jgi:hypothetical protein